MDLESIVKSVEPLDESAMEKAGKRQAELAKPPGSLGRLEDLSIQLAGITGRVHNRIERTHLLVFAADNGVTVEGVSSAPQSVTLMQTLNLTRAKTGAAVLAKRFGCGITVCDVGVNAVIDEPLVLSRKIAFGTGNIASGPAMTREQAFRALKTGYDIARETQAGALGVGEMGIGNTTTSSAVLSVLLGVEPEKVTGRGGGMTDEGFERKKRVIYRAIEVNRPDPEDVLDVLSKVGGFDIAAMCGAFLGAAASHRPAVIDGFISAVAALCAYRLCPSVRGYLIPSHASCETGYRLAMDAMGLEPIFDLGMRLGEGSGCPLAFQVLEAACAVINDMATFEEAGIDDGYLDELRRGGALGELILVSGVNDSGKSRFAEFLAAKISEKRYYIATMLPQTEDNFSRIEKHLRQREGLSFITLEIPYMVGDAAVEKSSAVLLEDVSNLLANVMFEKRGNAEDVFRDIRALQSRCGSLIAVTISGLDPSRYGGETAEYIRELNSLNNMLADRAGLVVQMENDAPVTLKGTLPYAP